MLVNWVRSLHISICGGIVNKSMIKLKPLQKYLLSKPQTTEEKPFGPQVLVYKVLGKMYALVAWEEDPLRISLKCDPEDAIVLRKHYKAITAGYHLDKKHWNTIVLDGSVPDEEVFEMIDDSFELIVEKMPKRDQAKILEG